MNRLLLSTSIVTKLQFSVLIVPMAVIAWKSLSKKELAKQLPGTAMTQVVVLRRGLCSEPADCSSIALRFQR
jgi:hypothetical protein